MKITITVEDENLDYRATAYFVESFDIAEEKLGQMRRNYERRVQMELDKADVMAEENKEEV